MYPDLSYFFHDLLGTAPDNWTSIFKTFGMFLASVFIVSAWLVAKEFRRMESEGLLTKLKQVEKKETKNSWIFDALTNGAIAGFLAYKIPFIISNFDNFKRDPASLLFSSGGNIIIGIVVFAAIIGYFYYYKQQNIQPFVKEWPHQRVGDIIIIAAVSGIIGSRLFSILEEWETFIQDPWGQIFSGSGLTIYGGLILATIVLVWYSKKINLPTVHLADAAAPALALGYGIGRMGCQFSGDGDWGIVNIAEKPSWFIFPDWAWAYDYPQNVLGRGVEIADCIGHYCSKLSQPVYPTPIYEILIAVVTFGLLWFLRTRLSRAGMLFFIYLAMTGLARFFIEGIRVNDKYDLLNLGWSLSQWLGFLFLIGGIVGFFIMRKNGRLINQTAIS